MKANQPTPCRSAILCIRLTVPDKYTFVVAKFSFYQSASLQSGNHSVHQIRRISNLLSDFHSDLKSTTATKKSYILENPYSCTEPLYCIVILAL